MTKEQEAANNIATGLNSLIQLDVDQIDQLISKMNELIPVLENFKTPKFKVRVEVESTASTGVLNCFSSPA